MTVFGAPDAADLIRDVRPHEWVKGADTQTVPHSEAEALLEVGAVMVRIVPQVDLHTSSIIERVIRHAV